MKFDGNYSCGHYGKIKSQYANSEEWAKEYFENNVCPDCAREGKRRVQEAKAEQYNAKTNLVQLEGTEKQIAYANVIRHKFLSNFDIDEFTKTMHEMRLHYETHSNKERANDEIENIILPKRIEYFENNTEEVMNKIKEIKSAKTWIDNRLNFDFEFVLSYVPLEKIDDSRMIKPNDWNNKVAIIDLIRDKITVKIEKNEKIKEFLKEHKFTWYDFHGGFWEKTPVGGDLGEDLACYVASVILQNKYAVIIKTYLHEQILSGNFEKEYTHLIYRYNDKLCISFPYSAEMVEKVKKIKGRRWTDGKNLVPLESYAEIEEFAKAQGFRFTEDAKILIKSYKAKQKEEQAE